MTQAQPKPSEIAPLIPAEASWVDLPPRLQAMLGSRGIQATIIPATGTAPATFGFKSGGALYNLGTTLAAMPPSVVIGQLVRAFDAGWTLPKPTSERVASATLMVDTFGAVHVLKATVTFVPSKSGKEAKPNASRAPTEWTHVQKA